MDLFVNITLGIMIAATPLVLAAIGEIVVERSGVLNLGVEGLMIIGAVAGFAATLKSESYVVGIAAAIVAGALMSGLFGVLTQTLRANQVASGLALTLFGLGLAALIGQDYSRESLDSIPRLHIPVLSDIPYLGRLLFSLDAITYASFALVVGANWFLKRTRAGLVVRAIGENHDAAHAIGYPVVRYRYLALLFGGACAGLGGAYLSLVQTPVWAEGMTAGRGWIALALVVFAAWRPGRALLGAYLFGSISILQLHSQASGIKIDAQLLSMLPYLATILVLVLISRDKMRSKLNAPACLGKPFYVAA
ncbi:MAG: ABC transporter permease [Hyphomicrobiaceae bacterium]|nr:MAG: ABC transporter permease [Hyphomicrobiaceae bacterium]